MYQLVLRGPPHALRTPIYEALFLLCFQVGNLVVKGLKRATHNLGNVNGILVIMSSRIATLLRHYY